MAVYHFCLTFSISSSLSFTYKQIALWSVDCSSLFPFFKLFAVLPCLGAILCPVFGQSSFLFKCHEIRSCR